jgi:hypothetical protein
VSRLIKESFFPEAIDTVKLSNYPCIIIDGDNHAGKSPLGRKIASALGAKLISLDDYLKTPGRPYCEHIDYDSLGKDMLTNTKHVVIEGVCILKVLSQIKARHDYHIFSKRIVFGTWYYEEYLSQRTPLPKNALERDIVEYYREFKPFNKCDETHTLFMELV